MRYSGLITKTRAMSGHLLPAEAIRQLTELGTVGEVINYLKGTEGYGSVFGGQEDGWHRGQAEAVIINSLYQDFEKLYRFSDAKQRLAFQYVFFRYETDVLKQLLKTIFTGLKQRKELYVDPFFYRHARFPVEQVKKATSLAEFEQALAGTPYEKVFFKLQHFEHAGYGDYATELETYYYTQVYKDIGRMGSGTLKEILKCIYGTQIDWLNLMWIYRSRRYYNQTRAELFALLIPFRYRIRKEELDGMLDAPGLPELNRILEQTAYFKGREAFVKMEDEISYQQVVEAMYRRVSQKYPMSMAPVLRYLFLKEQEMERLTTIIEGIRYQIPPKEIQDYILITN